MPKVMFTSNIQRHVSCPTAEVPGKTVREALDAVFLENERARGYVLDEQGHLRRHMVIFVDGVRVGDFREAFSRRRGQHRHGRLQGRSYVCQLLSRPLRHESA
jgi:hypothetical protein